MREILYPKILIFTRTTKTERKIERERERGENKLSIILYKATIIYVYNNNIENKIIYTHNKRHERKKIVVYY